MAFPGRKANRNAHPFYTFIGKDAIASLREYLDKDRGCIERREAIFLNEQGNPLTIANIERAFKTYGIKAGVIKPPILSCPDCGGVLKRIEPGHSQPRYMKCLQCGTRARRPFTKDFHLSHTIRYVAHPHEIRDLFRTEWHKSHADDMAAEFHMGHVERIDPNKYDKFYKDVDYLQEQYLVAEPYLNIISENPRMVPTVKVSELEKRFDVENQALKAELEKLRFADEQKLGEAKVENLEMARRLEHLEKLVADQHIFDSKSTEDRYVKTMQDNVELTSRLDNLECMVERLLRASALASSKGRRRRIDGEG